MSLIWVLNTYLTLDKDRDKDSYFWLLLGIGIVPYGIAFINWAYYFLYLGINPPYPGSADYFWLLAYFIWIIALIYKLILVIKKSEIIQYLFDISIFIIVTIALIWDLLLSNILLNLSGDILTDFVGVAYPVLNLSLLFITVLVYFTTRNHNNKSLFTFISLGFIFQISGDLIYVNHSLNSRYEYGDIIDPFWNVTLLLKGAAGLYRLQIKKSSVLVEKENFLNSTEVSSDKSAFALIAYFMCYVFFSYFEDLTFLRFSFYTVFTLMMIRQFFVLSQKEKSMEQLNSLSKSLEVQIQNKTKDLQHALIQVNTMAKFDNLTGLPNRYKFNERLRKSIERSRVNKKNLAIMFLDLDRFKIINDTMGHDTGDLLLVEVSNRLKNSVRKNDLVARLGGDEFVILLEGIDKNEVTEVAQRIIDEFAQPFSIKSKEFFTTTSIGISLFPSDGNNAEDIVSAADKAMYSAKERGKNNYQFYCIVSDKINRKMLLEEGLRGAINNKELLLHYQPQIDLNSMQIVGMEALLRWVHPELGIVSPDEFIPVAEESGLIIPIGKWVLHTACKQYKDWHSLGYPHSKMAINVSTYQFRDPNFIKDIKLILKETGLQPEFLELEITENLMKDIAQTRRILTELKKFRVSISIDDFGTGYSSLGILNELPIDRIKIDQMFVNNMLTNSKNKALVKSIIEMGKNLDFEIVAEGIENKEQEMILKNLNCNIGQGYLYSPPVPEKEIVKIFNL